MTDSITSIEESSSLTDRVNEILHSKALADLHALAWIETFFNKRDGNWDPGWSCRDHSVVLAALLTAKRIEARVVHGLTMFVKAQRQTVRLQLVMGMTLPPEAATAG